jgi:hypothetical protein
MRVQANHWLDYDAVALAVLVFGISAVTFLALNLWSFAAGPAPTVQLAPVAGPFCVERFPVFRAYVQ